MTKFRKIADNFFITNILIPLVLIIPILWFTIPAVSYWVDNIRMIRHFDIDEGNLVEFAGKTYSRGVIPLEDGVAYPQFFYYLAGIVLFPLTLLKGIDYRIIAIALRSLNIFAAIMTVILIYFFCRKFFKSIWVGIISGLSFMLCAHYLCWLLNSRPHPLEILLILATFYFCFKLMEVYRLKYLTGAIIFIGLAMATKYGGLFVVPIAVASFLCSIIKLPTNIMLGHLRNKFKLISFLSIFMMLITFFIPIIWILLYLRFPSKFLIFRINSFDDFIHFRDFRLTGFMSFMFFALSFFWWLTNSFAYRFANEGEGSDRHRRVFMLDLVFLFSVYILGFSIAIFVLVNPSYYIYPLNTIKRMVLQVAISTMSTHLDPRIHKPIFDPAGMVWFRMLFMDILNRWFTLLLIIGVGFQAWRWRSKLKILDDLFLKKTMLWLYSIILFLFIFIFLHHRPHHYLLPISLFLGILISLGIFDIIKWSKYTLTRISLIFFFAILLAFGFKQRLNNIIAERQYYIERNSSNNIADTGLLIGKWLDESYGPDIRIWQDCQDFYVPPKFKSVYCMNSDENIEKRFTEINKISPDLLIITSKFDPALTNDIKIKRAIDAGILKGYKQVKRFEYSGPLALTPGSGRYKEIAIYARG
ncbi:MAG: glycosyltransferase family 39 protein [Candidatus Omnitrophica bacterium]|nr:glycosyltransferase family 39 protein [Candidatus Omnitrophota bacterium]